MKEGKVSITILVADDDADDRAMIEDAMRESRLRNSIQFVADGEELMDYLLGRERFADREKFPFPGLLLLDLNMPKKDGREALKEIRSDPALRALPVVVLTTSKAEEDIYRTYNMGVNSFITKPVTFDALVGLVRDLGHYWLEIVELPAFKRE